MRMQNTLFGVLLPHIGGVVADLGRVFPLAAFFIAVFFYSGSWLTNSAAARQTPGFVRANSRRGRRITS